MENCRCLDIIPCDIFEEPDFGFLDELPLLASQSLKVSLTSVHFTIWLVFLSIVSLIEFMKSLYAPLIYFLLPLKIELPNGTNPCYLNPFKDGINSSHCLQFISPPHVNNSLKFLLMVGKILYFQVNLRLLMNAMYLTFKYNKSLTIIKPKSIHHTIDTR